MTPQPQQPIDPALFEVICAKEWFEKYGAQMMPGYFKARISAYKRIEKETIRSRPAPLTQNDNGNCLVICQHCGKVTQVKCADAAQAREDILTALAQDWKGRYVEDAVAEIRRFPESLRTGGDP